MDQETVTWIIVATLMILTIGFTVKYINKSLLYDKPEMPLILLFILLVDLIASGVHTAKLIMYGPTGHMVQVVLGSIPISIEAIIIVIILRFLNKHSKFVQAHAHYFYM